VDLASLAGEAVSRLRPTWEKKGLKISIDAMDCPTVGERFLLEEALGNLLQNAIDFSPPQGTIRIAVRATPEGARVAVEDEGPGIPDFAREKIFERFFSLPHPDTGEKSTGLGLSFVREIAALHGGRIRGENRSPCGAAFELTLPPT
jgi:two-component system sensor histidine kinase CreC